MQMGRFQTCFGYPVLNNSGVERSLPSLTGTSGGASDNTGIFRGSGGASTQIARRGQAAPDANGTFSSFGLPRAERLGHAAFYRLR